MEIETTKNSQRETTQDIQKPRKEIKGHRCTHPQQEKEERISGAEDTIENIDITVKEKAKLQKLLTQKIQEIQHTVRS